MNLYWLVPAYVAIVIIGFWLATRRGYCHRCHHHLNKCECCQHANCFPVRWTENGWTKVCRDCKEWLYLGDDFNERPADAPTYEPTRKER